MQRIAFAAEREQLLGERLVPRMLRTWPAYKRWFLRNPQPSSAVEGRAALAQHMPELLSAYDSLCQQLNADEHQAAFLSLYKPTSFRAGCSQACLVGDTPCLVRNYDFPHMLSDRLQLHSSWHGTAVIAMTDCLWGVLDGMNAHGLAVSLAYGGRNKRGDGFAITLVLRYLLEFCRDIHDALAALARVPVSMPYNVTLLDSSGACRTVALCPGETPEVLGMGFATNHQLGAAVEDLDALADSTMRERYLSSLLAAQDAAPAQLQAAFLEAPLLRRASEWQGWGTLYSACYQPLDGSAELFWPGEQRLWQGLQAFWETRIEVVSPAFDWPPEA